MNKLDKKAYKRRYYLKHKDHILFYQREYNLKYGNKHRKYYRDTNIQAQMPVDLFMMRNEMRFREGQRLDY